MQYREQVAGNSRFRLPSCSLYPIICNLQPAIGPRRRSPGNLPRFANGAAPEAEPMDNAIGCVEGTAILGLPEIDVTDPERQDLQRRILRIEAFTLAWMSVEAAVSLAPPGQRAARLCLPSAATARSSCCLAAWSSGASALSPRKLEGKSRLPSMPEDCCSPWPRMWLSLQERCCWVVPKFTAALPEWPSCWLLRS